MAKSQAPEAPVSPDRVPASPIPRTIRRNTLLLAAAQSLVGAGNQMIPTLGAIIVVRLLGSATFAGIGTSILGVSRFLVAYPVGRISDRYGRKAGIVAGLLVGMLGAALTGLAVLWASFPMFVAGLLVFGMGVGAAQQLRVAAADMYPPRLRGRGLGMVLTGSLVGALGGPIIINTARAASGPLQTDPTALAWLLIPAFILPGLVLVLRVRPDPQVVARELARYYPDYTPARIEDRTGRTVSVMTFVRHYPRLTAFSAMFVAQGVMSMMMALTALALSHHGHDLPAISLAVTIHVVGMYGLSLPFGRLVDRIGRRNVMLMGLAMSGAGATLVPVSAAYAVITAGIFLVGVGWSCVNVASSALIADTTAPAERGRAVGANDMFAAMSGITLPLLGGVLAEHIGMGIIGVFGVALTLVPAVMLLRLREATPGQYGLRAGRGAQAGG